MTDAIAAAVNERQLLEEEARRVETATRRSRREGRAVLNEILNRGRSNDPSVRAAALSFSARLCTLLRERDGQRIPTQRLDLWAD